MKLSVIIVNYNVRHFLEQALLSVRRAASGLAVEVFVVDNNSVDDSIKMVREKFPEVHLIANTDNPGFSIANNQAIRLSKGKYVLLLNPDTVVEEDTFKHCIRYMDDHPKAGALGVRMIDGSGTFLPESKRGFPSPWVAFCKTFGLSRLFPRSRWFNHYHLGYLPEMETHEVEVLAGAFLWMRRRVLDEVGLLDEAFFMYGEDIDLSYRITQGGYQNIYYPHTSIIHYKGESTKRGSLNYVRAFYQAMIIFARKHFTGQRARVFIVMLQAAIYFRAFLTLVGNWSRRLALPLLDGALIAGGLWFLKNFWATYHFQNPEYYGWEFLYVNLPLYTGAWLTGIYLSGGYDERDHLFRTLRGLLAATVLLAAIYGFLDLAYRSSRAIILMGAAWAMVATAGVRLGLQFFRHGNFNLYESSQPQKLVIVGTEAESQRVQSLLHKAQVQKNIIGTVAPFSDIDRQTYLSTLPQLSEVVRIYGIQEIIFCSKDVSAQNIMHWMSDLGPDILYKIVPQESMSIIGSSSKNSSGELYTIAIQFRIAQPTQARSKRLLDIAVALVLLLTLPVHLLLIPGRRRLLQRIFQVLLGRMSWVGYAPIPKGTAHLPTLRPGVLSSRHAFPHLPLDTPTLERLNFLYAKDYRVGKDVAILWRGYRLLGGGR